MKQVDSQHRDPKKIVDLILDNNRKFDWKVELLRRRISDESLKEHMEIVNGKYEDNGFSISSM